MEKINRNQKVKILKGSEIKGYGFSGGDLFRVAGRNYYVKVLQHYVEGPRNEIHWQGRHGNWFYTDIKNVVLA